MPLLVAAFAIAFVAWMAWPQIAKFRAATAAERAFTIRFTAFTWLIGVLFVLAFLFLPNKGRVVMMLPVFVVAVTLAKWWKNSRERLRRAAESDSNFHRARRIN
jgi:hypothetical protein